MRLADYYCNKCGEIAEDIFTDGPVSSLMNDCAYCGKSTVHFACCNGGIRSRWRYCDFPDDPAFYRGQTKIKATAHVRDGDTGIETPLAEFSKTGDGIAMQDRPRFSDDAREERRDKIYRETDRERGTTPIVCDLGKSSDA